MKKDFEVFEIGNGIWGGKLADGNDLAGNTVYKHFYGLSEKSVREQIRKYRRDPQKRGNSKTVSKMSEIRMGGGNTRNDMKSGSGVLEALKNNTPVRQDAVGCNVAVTVADITIIKYVDAQYDRINCSSEDGSFSKFRNDWEKTAHDDMAEKLEKGDMSVYELCSEWMKKRSVAGISKRTVECEKRICDQYVIPTAGEVICRNVSREDVEDIVLSILYKADENKEDGMMRNTTARVYLSSLNSLLEYGYSISALPERYRVYIDIHDI